MLVCGRMYDGHKTFYSYWNWYIHTLYQFYLPPVSKDERSESDVEVAGKSRKPRLVIFVWHECVCVYILQRAQRRFDHTEYLSLSDMNLLVFLSLLLPFINAHINGTKHLTKRYQPENGCNLKAKKARKNMWFRICLKNMKISYFFRRKDDENRCDTTLSFKSSKRGWLWQQIDTNETRFWFGKLLLQHFRAFAIGKTLIIVSVNVRDLSGGIFSCFFGISGNHLKNGKNSGSDTDCIEVLAEILLFSIWIQVRFEKYNEK